MTIPSRWRHGRNSMPRSPKWNAIATSMSALFGTLNDKHGMQAAAGLIEGGVCAFKVFYL